MAFLDDWLKKQRFCLLRAPPFSGKTSVATLLSDYLHRKGHNVVQLSALGKGSKYQEIDECWKLRTGKSWKEWLRVASPTTIIVDETQLWYDYGSGHPFWQDIKDQMQRQKSTFNDNLRILFIAAYGEGPQKVTSSGSTSTPIQFDEKCTLNIDFIRFNEEEFNELISNYNKTALGESIPISEGWCFYFLVYMLIFL